MRLILETLRYLGQCWPRSVWPYGLLSCDPECMWFETNKINKSILMEQDSYFWMQWHPRTTFRHIGNHTGELAAAAFFDILCSCCLSPVTPLSATSSWWPGKAPNPNCQRSSSTPTQTLYQCFGWAMGIQWGKWTVSGFELKPSPSPNMHGFLKGHKFALGNF